MKIEVTRAFYLGGELQELGAEIDVDARLAAELVHNHKAKRVVVPPADVPPADVPPADVPPADVPPPETNPSAKGGKGKSK